MVSDDDDAADWRAEARAEAGNADVERSAPPSRFERMKARPVARCAAMTPPCAMCAARRPDARRALRRPRRMRPRRTRRPRWRRRRGEGSRLAPAVRRRSLACTIVPGMFAGPMCPRLPFAWVLGIATGDKICYRRYQALRSRRALQRICTLVAPTVHQTARGRRRCRSLPTGSHRGARAARPRGHRPARGRRSAAAACAAARAPVSSAACRQGLTAACVASPAKNSAPPTGAASASRSPRRACSVG